MNKHLRNLRYLAKHKWGVLKAGLALRVPFWRLVIHDWAKLTLAEWGPYADHFFAGDPRAGSMHSPGSAERFDRAWLHHLHLSPHHWQHWVMIGDGGVQALAMPEHFTREMVADWIGAGIAQGRTDRSEAREWYDANKFRIVLHADTRALVESLLDEYTSGVSRL